MFQAMLARQTVGLFRAGKIIQADITDSQIAQHRGDIQRLAALQKFAVRPLIEVYCFLKAVLPVINIGDVAIEPGQTEAVFMEVKDCTRLLSQLEGPLILAVINQAVQSAADSAGIVNIAAKLLKDGQRFLVFLDGLLVLPCEIQNVAYGAGALRG